MILGRSTFSTFSENSERTSSKTVRNLLTRPLLREAKNKSSAYSSTTPSSLSAFRVSTGQPGEHPAQSLLEPQAPSTSTDQLMGLNLWHVLGARSLQPQRQERQQYPEFISKTT
eukprot:6484582-Amphidinium_carterae.1